MTIRVRFYLHPISFYTIGQNTSNWISTLSGRKLLLDKSMWVTSQHKNKLLTSLQKQSPQPIFHSTNPNSELKIPLWVWGGLLVYTARDRVMVVSVVNTNWILLLVSYKWLLVEQVSGSQCILYIWCLYSLIHSRNSFSQFHLDYKLFLSTILSCHKI